MKIMESIEAKEIIKLSAQGYAECGYSPIELLKEVAEWLEDCYEKTGDKKCLTTAQEVIKAYMELELPYEKIEKIFNQILQESQLEQHYSALRKKYCKTKGKLTYTKIREILGVWDKSVKGMVVDKVVREIMEKVRGQKKGCYCYGGDGLSPLFELVVMEREAFLIDIEKKKIYFLEQEKK